MLEFIEGKIYSTCMLTYNQVFVCMVVKHVHSFSITLCGLTDVVFCNIIASYYACT